MTEASDLGEVREEVDGFRKKISDLREQIGKTIVGNREVIDGVLTCLLAGGHALLEGVPGLAKTLSVKTIAQAITGDFKRIHLHSRLAEAVGVAPEAIFRVAIGSLVGCYVLAKLVLRSRFFTPKPTSTCHQRHMPAQQNLTGPACS